MFFLYILGGLAIILPVLSARGWRFAGLAVAAILCWFLGVYLCSEAVPGWDGLLCAVFGLFAAFLVVGSLIVGLFRVIKSKNGTQPIELGTLLGFAAAVYMVATFAIIMTIRNF